MEYLITRGSLSLAKTGRPMKIVPRWSDLHWLPLLLRMNLLARGGNGLVP